LYRTNGIAAACATALLAFGTLAFAHSGATGVVKERMEMMKEIGSGMKVIGEMIKGARPFDAAEAAASARAVANHAAMVPSLFPEGSTDSPSEASSAIWEDWDAFLELSDALAETGLQLATAAETASDASDIRAAFAATGRTCAACHEDFRIEK
jgi:cytochrome c556